MGPDQDADRPAALLTQAQRDYLRGGKSYRPSVERDVRRRIRERIQAGVADVSLLVDEFDGFRDDLEQAGEEITETSDLVALAVLIEHITPDYGTGVAGADDPDERELTITVGVSNAFQALGISYEKIDATIKEGDPLRDLAEGDLATLPESTLNQLLTAGVVTQTEFAEAVLEREAREASTSDEE